MKIIETRIPDVTPDTVEESKVVLANNIIKNVYPLFDEVYQEKIKQQKIIKEHLTEIKKEVSEKKQGLESLMNEYNKEKKIAKLLSRIEKLVDSGLVYDGTIKNQTVILLKVMDKLSEEKIDHHLVETLQIIRKRFSRT